VKAGESQILSPISSACLTFGAGAIAHSRHSQCDRARCGKHAGRAWFGNTGRYRDTSAGYVEPNMVIVDKFQKCHSESNFENLSVTGAVSKTDCRRTTTEAQG
jgi:hypothetical protein